jgi:hypothetical protein
MSFAVHISAAPAFDSTFFATAAAVIPVLFLALSIQGTLFNRAAGAYRRTIKTAHKLGAAEEPKAAATHFVADSLRLALALVLFAGTGGELLAIYALYQQQAIATTKQGVLDSVIILVVAAAIGTVFLASPRAHAARHRDHAGAAGPDGHLPPETAEAAARGPEPA